MSKYIQAVPAAINPMRRRGHACGAHQLVALTLSLCLGAAPAAAVDSVAIDHAPVFLLSGVAPNLILTLDNSTSMGAAHSDSDAGALPSGTGTDTAALSNALYYDPAIVYLPPTDATGRQFPHADFASAPRDFFRNQAAPGADRGCTLDLGSHYAPLWMESDPPCSEQLASGDASLYTVDPGNPEFADFYRATRAPRSTWPLIGGRLVAPLPTPDQARSWALYCLYDVPLPTAVEEPGDGSDSDPIVDDETVAARCPAFYFQWDPGLSYGGDADLGSSCGGLSPATLTADQKAVALPACLNRIVVGSDEDIDRSDDDNPRLHEERARLLRTRAEADTVLDDAYKKLLAKRNFANWYSYYRNRWRALQTAIAQVTATLDPSVRVAYQGMTPGNTAPAEFSSSFGAFDAERRQDLQNWLFSLGSSNSTSLIASALRVETFCTSDRAYLEDPALETGAELPSGQPNRVLGCRNNFHLMFTDGVWDDVFGGSLTAPDWLGNNDGTATDLPLDRSYARELATPVERYDPETEAARVYGDRNTGGLADVVFHSWITDLRPSENGEEHRVSTLIWDPVIEEGEDDSPIFWDPRNDPADWQHITTYTVGLGLVGEVAWPEGDYGTDGNVRSDGFPGAWVAPGLTGSTAPGSEPSAAERIDDLWHAGIDGRGGYRSARDSAALIESLQSVVDAVSNVAKQQASAASPSFNSGSASTTRMAFQASLNSSNWTGDLKAFQVSGGPGAEPCPDADIPRGQLCQDPGESYYWSAADRMNGVDGAAPLWSTRKLVTGTASYDQAGEKTGTGVRFGSAYWGSLTDSDKRVLLDLAPEAALPASDSAEVARVWETLDYIAGKRDYEGRRRADDDPYTFRDRDGLLGDIVRAAPVMVSTPSAIFNDAEYLAYAQEDRTRREIVYVGANDGLLHGFDVETGDELFGYVPRPLFGKLKILTEPGYGDVPPHTNFVDGPLASGEVYLSGEAAWNPVVVGGLGLGAQAVFAIRSPRLPASGAIDPDAADIHLWDFTDRDDPDLGYVLGKPSIVRVLMSDGTIKWVAVFGNGYNSSIDDGYRAAGCDNPDDDNGATACGRAVLYVVDIETGALVAKLDTQRGRNDDPRHRAETQLADREPNGLGQVVVIGRIMTNEDGDPIGGGDPIATVAYAGDLFGNLWRFDLTGLDLGDASDASPVLLFSAANGQGVAQPITAAVEVAPHPTGVGTMVLFGTGRYLAQADASDYGIQTFYGIWDKGLAGSANAPSVARSDLLEQRFVMTDERIANRSVQTLGRTSTRNQPNWSLHLGWRLDLIETENGQQKGERVVTGPQVRGDRVVFVSIVPETNPCKRGGFSWINAVSLVTGSALEETPFDYDRDGAFDSADLLIVDEDGTLEVGSSIRFAEGGIYSSPATLPLLGGQTKTVVATSEGELIELLESSVLDWRVWNQIQ